VEFKYSSEYSRSYMRVYVVLSFVRPKNETLKQFFSQFEFDLARASLFHARATSACGYTRKRAAEAKSEKATLRSRVFSQRERERDIYLFLVKRRVNEEEEEEEEEKQTQFEFFFQFNF